MLLRGCRVFCMADLKQVCIQGALSSKGDFIHVFHQLTLLAPV